MQLVATVPNSVDGCLKNKREITMNYSFMKSNYLREVIKLSMIVGYARASN